MSDKKKLQKNTEAESANQELNEKFNGKQQEVSNETKEFLTETEEANLELNKELDSDGQDTRSSPASYLYNNTAAIDVTKKE
ncbi:hypothetical protein [Planomicrobium sp. CPCC 101079]|uniref:hypothetical protein n=1 Tax=Planomicrobium sp. CPCC 101079 TaxID=2599618 RepID=UPI0011B7B00D|nr:hypothetical protein [Planomicrobium sp. CPCC 101079]TWT09242.1 hypothetical protein FQV28_06305 [Planomicrobium sp. CPCC 101079]